MALVLLIDYLSVQLKTHWVGKRGRTQLSHFTNLKNNQLNHLITCNCSPWLNCDNMAANLPFPVTDSVCYLCTSSLKDSVVLRCCHSLCKICVQSYWELNKSLECPVCLRETHCSVLLHHLSISRFTSEAESSQDSNFKPLHVGNAESEMVSELHYT